MVFAVLWTFPPLLAALLLFLAGGRKLMDLDGTARDAWRPARFERANVRPLLAAVSIAEMAIALGVVLSPNAGTAALSGVVLIGVTTYGVVALSRGGSCSCRVPMLQRVDRIPVLLLRNGVLAIALVSHGLQADATQRLHLVAPLLGLAPLAAVLALAIFGMTFRRRTGVRYSKLVEGAV